MSATIDEISDWFAAGRRSKATHMIVVCDGFDHEDYPVYIRPNENFWERYAEYDNVNMQRIMEVYDLSKDKQQQINTVGRVMNTPPKPPDTTAECSSGPPSTDGTD